MKELPITTIQIGNCMVISDNKQFSIVKKDLTPFPISKKSFQILEALAKTPGALVKRNYLLDSIWQNENYYSGRSMDVFVTKLRNVFKVDTNISIVNTKGVGLTLKIDEGDK